MKIEHLELAVAGTVMRATGVDLTTDEFAQLTGLVEQLSNANTEIERLKAQVRGMST